MDGYFKPIKTLAPGADHRDHKGLNNAIEGSHRPMARNASKATPSPTMWSSDLGAACEGAGLAKLVYTGNQFG